MSLFPGGTAWAAITSVARRELRRGWAGLVVLGLLAGFAGGIATGAVVVERRTATAEDRLRVAMGVEELRISTLGNPLPSAAGIPGIARQWQPSIAVGRMEGTPGLNYLAVLSGPPHPGIFNPVVVKGRAVNPESIDELSVAEYGAAQLGIGLGRKVTLRFLAADQAQDWTTGIGEPRGRTMTFTVVGLTRISPKTTNGVGIMASPAFYRQFGTELTQGGVLMIQTEAASPPESIAARLAGRVKAGTTQVEYPSRESGPVRTAVHILTGGALSFLVVAGLVGLIALAQFSGRHHSAGVQAQQVERILGLTRGERVLGHAAPSLLSAAVAALLTAAGGIAAGFIEPIGSLKTSEPHPGFQLNVAVTLSGAAIAAACVVVISAVTAARATVLPSSSRSPRRSLRLLRSAVPSAGVRLALGGRGSVRLASAATGVTIAVAGMLASLSVHASLGHLVDTPRNWGSNADLSIADARPELVDQLRDDPRIAAMTYSTVGRARIGGQDVPTYSEQYEKGRMTWTTVEGREPRDDAEVMLGTRLAGILDLVTGDTVAVTTPRGPERFTVSGIGIGPRNGEAFGDNALLTPGGLLRSDRSDPFYDLDVKLVPGASVSTFVGELAKEWEIILPTAPAEVSSLNDLNRLPLYLAAFFVTVGLAALTHSTVLMLRRSQRELAVLHTIGFTKAQVAGSLLVATLVTTTIGLMVGVPLGLAVGRLAWWQVAAGLGVVPAVQLPGPAALLTVPVALLAAVLVAAWPTWRAGRLPLQRALRAD